MQNKYTHLLSMNYNNNFCQIVYYALLLET